MVTYEILLTKEQRLEFTQISQNISEWEIAKHYTFTDNDMEIINQHRRDYNRLGFAVQLCCLRNPGWSLNNISSVPYTVLSYIAEQLQVNPNEFEQYAQRVKTKSDHLQELREAYGFRNFSKSDYKYLLEYLMPYAMENDNVIKLIRITIEELKRRMVILPGITTLERIVNKVRQTADETVIKFINESLTDAQKHR
jgi:TnpA family transposase